MSGRSYTCLKVDCCTAFWIRPVNKWRPSEHRGVAHPEKPHEVSPLGPMRMFVESCSARNIEGGPHASQIIWARMGPPPGGSGEESIPLILDRAFPEFIGFDSNVGFVAFVSGIRMTASGRLLPEDLLQT